MKRFLNQVRADLKHGIAEGYLRYVIVFVISVVLSNDFFQRMASSIQRGGIENVSFAEGLLSFFEGMDEYISGANSFFEIPVSFLLINIFLAFIIGDYATKDIYGFGKLTLVRSKTRWSWWNSKVLWCIASVLLFYLVIYAGVAFMYLVRIGIPKTALFEVREEVMRMIIPAGYQPGDMNILLWTVILLPVCTSIAVSMLQVTLAFLTSPIISYVITLAIFVFSAYFMKWFLVGNYLMIYRSSIINENGIVFRQALITDAVLFGAAFVGGYLYFRRFDVLSKE